MTDERGKRIEDKLDKVSEDVGHVKLEMVEIRKDLSYHIKRSDTLEQVVKPINDFIITIRTSVKILGILALIAGIVEGATILLEHIHGK